jgi:RHS repeat-associated protein
MQIGVEGPGTVKFQWKVSSESGYDYLEFWVDGIQRDAISGITDWAEKTFTVTGAGPHTLKWGYAKDGSESIGEDCGWLDGVQWAGSDPWDNWTTLLYRAAWPERSERDAAGRRVEKLYNYATITKYVYDGDHCIAEYDSSDVLRRKYIYGPGIDQPVCMIEAAGSYAGTYYYHFDALGNVVALTSGNVDHMGETVQVYDYDVYGRVGATDASHPNRFMFTGREFDKETGLYYYRARYYNAEIGRFLQTDPVGHEAGMNLYAYCQNTPWNLSDPLGTQAGAGLDWGRAFGYNGNDPNGQNGTGPHDANWVDCMGRCIADNDPLDLAIGAAIGALTAAVTAGPIPKRMVYGLAKGLSYLPEIPPNTSKWLSGYADEVKRGWKWGHELTTLPSEISLALRAGGRSALRVAGRKAATIVGPVWIAYGLALAAVEVHCLGYCTSCSIQNLPYNKDDANFLDTLRDTYFSSWK